MMKLNNEEWTKIADAIAGAHMLNQAVYALLKQRKADLNRDQRQLLAAVPELVRTAFQLLGKIDRRERGEPDEPTNTPTSDISKLDIRVLRNESKTSPRSTCPTSRMRWLACWKSCQCTPSTPRKTTTTAS